MDAQKIIVRNKKIHDAVVARYEKKHGEIFNPREQERLFTLLQRTCDLARVQGALSSSLHVLDVGAGSGNLTKHLVDLGCDVVAADVSSKALAFVRSRFPNIKTSVLNGSDLS